MQLPKDLISKYMGLQTIFKSFFLLIILFLVFFAVNLFISVKGKHESAYNVLSAESEKNEKAEVMLQDTRVHNWSELNKRK